VWPSTTLQGAVTGVAVLAQQHQMIVTCGSDGNMHGMNWRTGAVRQQQQQQQ
jgi:hypothetical protein